ncbi:MAG: type I DNA topoisomerase [bacterium]
MAKKSADTQTSNKTLVIVESPSKAKTIKKYLGEGYEVRASVGHIRDLPKSKLGFDEVTFEPVYEVSKDKTKVIKELKQEAKKVNNNVMIATDPDREGEAIAWHVSNVLGFKESEPNRVFFTEITKDAVNEAIKKPRPIDMDLVDAQQARRILDRIVGYKLSPLLWTKIRYGLSAGRVQSVALRIIVDREREREKFVPEEYWDMKLDAVQNQYSIPVLKTLKSEDEDKKYTIKGIEFNLVKKDGKKFVPHQDSEITVVLEEIKTNPLNIVTVNSKIGKKYPKPPFTTSTLQQAAINRLGFTSKRTMSAAQKLYEAGYITYMRTDSTNLASSALDAIRGYIRNEYGDRYLPFNAIHYKTTSKGAQEAHEAIRPTNMNMRHVPENMRDDEKKLYDLIWRRTASCQMSSAEYNNTTIVGKIKEYEFNANGSIQIFDGFQKVYGIDFDDKIFPFEVKEGDILGLEKILSTQHFTEPPARYNEASLVKALEKYGIGRPSTYASIISTILARGYVEKEGKALKPTDTGMVVNDFLVKFFPTIVDRYFTAEMEGGLDQIAEGKNSWKPMVKTFFDALVAQIDEKKESIKKEDVVILGESDEICDLCGAPMKIKLGKYGKFLTCSKFPECKGIKSLEEASDEAVELDTEKFEGAPKARDGETDMVLKKGRFGMFWAHPDYPTVKETAPLLLKEMCPDCGHNLVERKGRWGKFFMGCSNYPNCRYIKGAKFKATTTPVKAAKGKIAKDATAKKAPAKRTAKKPLVKKATTRKPATKKNTGNK